MKKSMRTTGIIFGAIAIVLLMVSSATAVPQVNAEPVMDELEKLDELEQLMNELNLDYLFSLDEIDEESLQEKIDYFNNFLSEQGIPGFDVEEMYSYFSAEEYKEYLLSDEFADLFNHDDIQNLLNSDDYLDYVTNNEEVISFVNSESFISFFYSDFAQQVLDNIKNGGNSNVLVSQGTATLGSQTTSTTPQAPLNTGGGEDPVLEETATVGSVQIPQADPEELYLLFDGLLIGIIAYMIYCLCCILVPFLEITAYIVFYVVAAVVLFLAAIAAGIGFIAICLVVALIAVLCLILSPFIIITWCFFEYLLYCGMSMIDEWVSWGG